MDGIKMASIKNNMKIISFVVLISALLVGHSAYADDRKVSQTSAQLSLKMAKEAAMSALGQCRREGYAVSVAVVDRSGTLLVQVRDPDAGPHTIGSSKGKAFTSASMGRATTPLANAIAENPALNGLRDMDPRMVILGGGLPIMLNGQRVGVIGVGGAPGGHLDEACATYGLQQIGAGA